MPQDVDFAVVPGLAFTPDGQRMGRGKGYYDRLIPQLTHAVKVSVAFPFQLCEQIPQDPWDERVDVVFQTKPLSDTNY
jgi:5-formyltetrahydrofolate cyclo-ligase